LIFYGKMYNTTRKGRSKNFYRAKNALKIQQSQPQAVPPSIEEVDGLRNILGGINTRRPQNQQLSEEQINALINGKNKQQVLDEIQERQKELDKLVELRTPVIQQIDSLAKALFQKGNKNVDIPRPKNNDIIRCTKYGSYLIYNNDKDKALNPQDGFGQFTFENGDDVKR